MTVTERASSSAVVQSFVGRDSDVCMRASMYRLYPSVHIACRYCCVVYLGN